MIFQVYHDLYKPCLKIYSIRQKIKIFISKIVGAGAGETQLVIAWPSGARGTWFDPR